MHLNDYELLRETRIKAETYEHRAAIIRALKEAEQAGGFTFRRRLARTLLTLAQRLNPELSRPISTRRLERPC